MWVVEVLAAALGFTRTRIFCDALMEQDRYYFSRKGVIDRRGNPRPIIEAARRTHV